MAAKPTHADGYRAQVDHVRATCLYLATKLGDLLDEMVIVGGLAPSLLIDQRSIASMDDRHVGTTDLDVGLAVAILDDQRYQALSDRLRRAGFGPDQNESARPTSQRWKLRGTTEVTVDFLVQPSLPGDKGGTLRHFERDFAAFITPGLHLAFADRERVRIEGATPFGEIATFTY